MFQRHFLAPALRRPSTPPASRACGRDFSGALAGEVRAPPAHTCSFLCKTAHTHAHPCTQLPHGGAVMDAASAWYSEAPLIHGDHLIKTRDRPTPEQRMHCRLSIHTRRPQHYEVLTSSNYLTRIYQLCLKFIGLARQQNIQRYTDSWSKDRLVEQVGK